jgi:hypothetical protein
VTATRFSAIPTQSKFRYFDSSSCHISTHISYSLLLFGGQNFTAQKTYTIGDEKNHQNDAPKVRALIPSLRRACNYHKLEAVDEVPELF